MLKCQNQRGARCPGALPVPPPMNTKAKSKAFWKNEYAPQRPITTTFQWVKPTGPKSIMALNDSTNLVSLFVEVCSEWFRPQTGCTEVVWYVQL